MPVRLLGLVACLALMPRAGTAQTAVIEGRVTVAPAGRAADAADVRIEGTPLTTVTDTAGRYRIGPVPPGPQVLGSARSVTPPRAWSADPCDAYPPY